MTELETKLTTHFLILRREVEHEISLRRHKLEYPGGQHVSLTSQLQGWSLSSLLKVQRDCKFALAEVPEHELEEIKKRFEL